MKTIVLIFLLTLLAVCDSPANSVIIIDITTTDAGSSYKLNHQPKTPVEIETLLRAIFKDFVGDDPVFIRPDDRTSFGTVLEMLRRFKAAGVKRFEVVIDPRGGERGRTIHSLSGTVDQISSQQVAAQPAPK
ncbi:MAG TPA: hypothetical protein VGO11_14330 [Chthoniobacteraceae bacterium]|jgi:biopolymer transport protein ExbD|nr:hypothetical protein [Chthoniobacteraceae bacterium]